MTKQPEALRLADWLESDDMPTEQASCADAAAELRRLHEVNQELLGALNDVLSMPEYDGTTETSVKRREAKHKARAAIAKTQGEQA